MQQTRQKFAMTCGKALNDTFYYKNSPLHRWQACYWLGPKPFLSHVGHANKKQNQSKLKMRKTYGVHLQRKRQNNSEWSRQTVKPIRNDRLLRAVEVWSFVKKKNIQQSTSILKQLDQTHLIVVNFSIHRPHLRQYNSFIPCVASSLANVNGAVIWRKRQLCRIKNKSIRIFHSGKELSTPLQSISVTFTAIRH